MRRRERAARQYRPKSREQPFGQSRDVLDVGKGLFQVEEVASDPDSSVPGHAPERDCGNRLDPLAEPFGRIEEREARAQADDAAEGAKALEVLRRKAGHHCTVRGPDRTVRTEQEQAMAAASNRSRTRRGRRRWSGS